MTFHIINGKRVDIGLGTFWACRLRGTNRYFLERPVGSRAGYTFQEPGALTEGTLRLFRTHKAALAAVIAWAKGNYVVKVYESIWPEQDNYRTAEYKPVPGRSRDSIEIIQVSINEVFS